MLPHPCLARPFHEVSWHPQGFLLETIDSKVFYVVGAISLLAILLMATVTLEPIPSERGLSTHHRSFSRRCHRGRHSYCRQGEGDARADPVFGSGREGAETPSRPWEAEYQFVVESRDQLPLGGRIAILQHLLQIEEDKERAEKTGRKSRARFSRMKFGGGTPHSGTGG